MTTRIRRFGVLVAALLMVACADPGLKLATAPTSTSLTNVSGVWVLEEFDTVAAVAQQASAIASALAVPGVRGLSVRVPMSLIAGGTPAAPTFDFTVFNDALALAKAAGKPMAVRFISGRDTPAAYLGNSYKLKAGLPGGGQLAPVPWGVGSTPTSFLPNTTFEQGFSETVSALAAWCRAQGAAVPELHLPWFSGPWAEIYLNTDLEAVPGYSMANFVAGHLDLWKIGQALAGPDLAVEFPFSGYGTNIADTPLAAAIKTASGSWPANMVVQLNNLTDTGNTGSIGYPIFHGAQMLGTGDYNWTAVISSVDTAHDVTLEIYLTSFAAGLTHHAQLLTAIETMAAYDAPWAGGEPGPSGGTGPTPTPSPTPTATPTPTPGPTPQPINNVPCSVTLPAGTQVGTCSGTFLAA